MAALIKRLTFPRWNSPVLLLRVPTQGEPPMCTAHQHHPETAAAPVDADLSFYVEDMTCGHCAGVIKGAIERPSPAPPFMLIRQAARLWLAASPTRHVLLKSSPLQAIRQKRAPDLTRCRRRPSSLPPDRPACPASRRACVTAAGRYQRSSFSIPPAASDSPFRPGMTVEVFPVPEIHIFNG